MLDPFSTYVLIFIAGIAGSMHCVGMCGGFACALGADARGSGATLRRHLTYNVGRVTTYCFLGALAGFLGAELVGHAGDESAVALAQRMLAAVSGALMIYIGLQFLGYFSSAKQGVPGSSFLAAAFRDLLKAPGPGAPLAFGVANGFLPCPLVYAFAAQAAAGDGALPGMVVMAAFGLGTFPAMLVMGGAGIWMRSGTPQTVSVSALKGGSAVLQRAQPTYWQLNGVRIAGAFIVVLGLITLARGLLPLALHGHH
ncbi:MAG: sulfite exporter TauE/SafE family protein [Burkholderiales bacterium]